MKKILFCLAAFAALVSCTKENPVDETPTVDTPAVEYQTITFEATAPSAEDADATKTTLINGSLVNWVKGDEIKILFFPNAGWGAHLYEADVTVGANGVFTTTFESETSATAYFSGEINWSHGSEYMDSGIAIYPSTVEASSNRPAGNYMYGNNTVITYDLSNEQTAVENSFQNGLAFSYAEIESEDKEDFIDNKAKLAFKNACALIKVTLPADAKDIMSVKVESADANLAGDYKATISATDKSQKPDFPLVLKDYGKVVSKHVTLSAPTGETLKAGASYYIVTWPGSHSNGLSFTFTNTSGLTNTKQLAQSVELEASKIDHFYFKNSITFEHVFEVSEDSFDIAGTATGGSFTVTSSRDWTAVSDSEWLTISPASGSASVSAATVTFNAPENTSAERTAKITITAGEDTKVITVTQAQFIAELSIERYGSWNILPADGDFQFVTIKSNTSWTLSCDKDWLTLGATSGSATAGETVMLTAAENTTTSERTATLYLRDNSNTVEKTFTVTQEAAERKFRLKSAVTAAADLKAGNMYVIFFAGGSSNNSLTNYCWEINDNETINRVSSSYETGTEFTSENVFMFDNVGSPNESELTDSNNGYGSKISGKLKSVHNNKYVTSSLMFDYPEVAGGSTMMFGNQWGNSESGHDIDIWFRTYSNMNYSYAQTLYWDGSSLKLGSTTNTPRKWFFFEVEEVK